MEVLKLRQGILEKLRVKLKKVLKEKQEKIERKRAENAGFDEYEDDDFLGEFDNPDDE